MEHPFAPFIQILGKGRRGARDLTREEARDAMSRILAGQVEPIQLGAFLMLMRVKEETPEEVAGFVEACRGSVRVPSGFPTVDLDWSSYAGKRRHLPWNLLSALLLASHGTSVLIHGVASGTAGRLYLPEAMAALGLQAARSIDEAARHLGQHRFAFLPLAELNHDLDRMLSLKSVLGLRSPIHTVVRMLNPFSANASMMGIFHPGYDETHQQAGVMLGDRNLVAFKGEGGEAERNPDAACTARMVLKGLPFQLEWPAQFAQRHLKEDTLDPARLRGVWEGTLEDEYAKGAIVGTTAIALTVLGRAGEPARALEEALTMWQNRNVHFLESARG
jgi:anthranilate phosphoribosyltransferase